MDRLESLGSTLSQITMYDIKSMYNQAKNVVLNVSEVEAKVREATNDDPWGASSTLMQDIANRTFNYPDFNEIMPSIYARFMEKEARQWRQIYKALQLLEYLIKHGSERVVDDARSHVSTIKMLRSFHFIDDKGKDEGINVRNRAKEIVELLADVDKIRSERRKAKANKSKYIGVGSEGGMGSFSSGGGSRYGGFGSESWNYGGGGGGGGGSNDYGSYSGGGSGAGSSSFRDDNRRAGGFEEYNAGDDEVVTTSPVRSNSISAGRAHARKASAPAPAPAPVQEVDLLGGFGDDDPFGSTSTAAKGFATDKALPAVGHVPMATQQPSVGIDDDDFDDFQAAPVQNVPAAGAKPNLMDMLSSTPARPTMSTTTGSFTQPQQQPAAFTMGMGMGGGMHRQTSSISSTQSPPPFYSSPIQPQQQQQSLFGGAPLQPTSTMRPMQSPPMSSPTTAAPPSKPAASANFDDLWSMSLGSKPTTPGGTSGAGKSIKDLEKEKASAGLWGGQQAKPPMGAGMQGGSAFGAFGGTSSTNNAGGDSDDLLL